MEIENNVLASLTNNIALKAPSKYLIDDTFAVMRVVFDQYWSSFTMSMKDIQCSNEKFVGILLLVTCQVSDVGPNQMEKLVKRQWSLVARIELLEQMGYLANQTATRLRAVMTVSKEVVS